MEKKVSSDSNNALTDSIPSVTGERENDEWIDATEVFVRARDQLGVGEMVHQDSFSLHSAMSAIELMDPKMDIGCGSFREISDVFLPHQLSDVEVIAILDNLLACQLSWMHAHTLPQTVFSCLYHQRLSDCRRPDLLSFMYLQLGTMRGVLSIIQTARVAEEEDFITWTYGFRLPPLTEAKAQLLWEEMYSHFSNLDPPATGADHQRGDDILDRLKLMWLLFRAINMLATSDGSKIADCTYVLAELKSLLKRIRLSATNPADCQELLSTVFDASVNRHLLTNTPPRTAAVFSVNAGLDALETLLNEFSALCSLSKVLLPRGPPLGSVPGTDTQQFSFHNALHGLSVFSALHRPSILTRSLMKHMILVRQCVCFEECAHVSTMLLTDTGAPLTSLSSQVLSHADMLAPFALEFFSSLLRNRGRQRRHLVKALAMWDEAVSICFRKPERVPAAANGTGEPPSQEAAADGGEPDVYCGKTSLELVAHEVSARMMIQHWLLGFECNLYMPYEYATTFFYLGYVLSAGQNATASLAGANAATQAGSDEKGTELHASRFALYLLDEGRLWLCRALYSFLDALSIGELWNTSLKRPEESDDGMFGSEKLWYEQRFGFTRSNATGPSYVDYGTFKSLMKLQEENLLDKANTDDPVIARLADAANSFLTARRALERASKASKFYGWDVVSDEIRDLARVVVVNSIEVSQQRRTYPVWLQARKYGVGIKRSDVTIEFKTHRHFPTISVAQGV